MWKSGRELRFPGYCVLTSIRYAQRNSWRTDSNHLFGYIHCGNGLKRFHNYFGLIRIVRAGFHWEKTTVVTARVARTLHLEPRAARLCRG
jgi:hypothetical protein